MILGAAAVAQNIFFYLIAAVMVFSAFRVVTTKNVVHAALFLVAVLAGVGMQFILLTAEFVAVTQVLVYIGAVVVLILFGTMLTRAKIGRDVDLTHDYWYAGAITAVMMFGVMSYSLWDAFDTTPLPDETRIGGVNNTAAVSDSIFGQYLVPFEAISVLLLAALIGAIVIARRD